MPFLLVFLKSFLIEKIGVLMFKTIARWVLPKIIDALMDLARTHYNDPSTDADDKWYDETVKFLNVIAQKKLS